MDKDRYPGPDDLVCPFVFVPHGAPDPVDWMHEHPGWVRFPATFVPGRPVSGDPVAASESQEVDDRAPHSERNPDTSREDAAGFLGLSAALNDRVGMLRKLGYDLGGRDARSVARDLDMAAQQTDQVQPAVHGSDA